MENNTTNNTNTTTECVNDTEDNWIPQHEPKSYKLLIWQEEIPEMTESVRLHLVKRNNSSFIVA